MSIFKAVIIATLLTYVPAFGFMGVILLLLSEFSSEEKILIWFLLMVAYVITLACYYKRARGHDPAHQKGKR